MRTITHSPRPAVEPSLGRWLWTNNPFYLVSAVLVLFGLFRLSRQSGPWTLLAGLEGYTLLVAGAAVLIVRVGRVWEDARSVLLVLVLLLVASTVAADPIAESDPALGALVLAAAFPAAILLVEGVLAGCRIRLPLVYRLPCYALLALFHGYPVLLAHLLEASHEGELSGLAVALAAFPWAGALLLVGLVPAARRGRTAGADGGTPWSWPAFPWAAIAVLAACLPVRGYLAGMAFYPGRSNPIDLALLAPIAIGVAVLLLELGRAAGDRRLETAGLWLPVLAGALSLYQGGREFDRLLLEAAGNPAWATWAAACGVYGWRTLAGDGRAKIALAASIATLCVLSPTAHGVHAPGPLALAAVTGLAAWAAIRSRRSIEATLALGAAVALAARLLAGVDAPAGLERAIVVGPALAAAHAIGAFYRDEFARWVRLAASAALTALALHAFWKLDGAGLAAGVGAALLAGAGYAIWTRDRAVAACVGLQGAVLLYQGGRLAWQGAAGLLERPGTGLLVVGLLAFGLGAAITAAKARRTPGDEDRPVLEPVLDDATLEP